LEVSLLKVVFLSLLSCSSPEERNMRKLLDKAETRMSQGRLEEADEFLVQAGKVDSTNADYIDLKQRMEAARESQVAAYTDHLDFTPKKITDKGFSCLLTSTVSNSGPSNLASISVHIEAQTRDGVVISSSQSSGLRRIRSSRREPLSVRAGQTVQFVRELEAKGLCSDVLFIYRVESLTFMD
jgi:hypothetical protein